VPVKVSKLLFIGDGSIVLCWAKASEG